MGQSGVVAEDSRIILYGIRLRLLNKDKAHYSLVQKYTIYTSKQCCFSLPIMLNTASMSYSCLEATFLEL